MSDPDQDSLDSATHDSSVTVEVDLTISGNEKAITKQWTFEQQSPQQAKEIVVSECVRSDATLWRIGLWFGTANDRPTGGHEDGILE
jgi:hypothetical protein